MLYLRMFKWIMCTIHNPKHSNLKIKQKFAETSTYRYCANNKKQQVWRDATSCENVHQNQIFLAAISLGSLERILRMQRCKMNTFQLLVEWKPESKNNFLISSNLSKFCNTSLSYICHLIFLSSHFKVPVNCWNDAERSPTSEHSDFDIIWNFQLRNLHNHWNYKHNYNCCNVESLKNLQDLWCWVIELT